MKPSHSSTFRTILTVACGVALGILLIGGVERVAIALGILPDGELREASAYVRDVMTLVNNKYVDPEKSRAPELAKSALHGVLESLDPHSEFLEEKYFRELEEGMASEFGGIGVQIELRKERVRVITPMPNTPGERAGIRRGDEIRSIDGVALENPTMDGVVEKLRGKPKTKVDVGLFRASENREFTVTLTREKIQSESVRNARLLEGAVGYLQITQFTDRTGEEFYKALNALASQNATSLIIDLRNNPGGVLDSAIDVAEPFFKKGELILFTQGRAPGDREEFRSGSDEPPINVPVAVLINAHSASAAEIVAGALKDTNRAVIVGERSFGKGSVQSVFKLKNGEGMRLTTARYFTPGGVTIHERGVAPQIEVVLEPKEEENIGLQLSRPDLAADPAEFKERLGTEIMPDRQLQAAITALQGVTILGRQ
ncbi:carboxyl-terminal processing protease [Ereboglobus sp. PH5-10]|uniref:S41 family peptidase n=1 Tax=Ereboglobus sp. PH5-10 TaxID=2940629 RepID=UPI002405BC0D|nr:S41 family peptidase [Ereboglobus sp. PH5-10]MDF9826993.1 carboxyl-terminal processing protease [Ereboglobus sp. PH5-10]